MSDLNITINLSDLSEDDRNSFLKLINKVREEPIQKKTFNPFERCKKDDNYYYIDDESDVITSAEWYEVTDYKSFDVCNYYNDRDFAEHQALRELLNRKLMKFSYENGGADIDVEKLADSFSIYYSEICSEFLTNDRQCPDILSPVFVSREVAQRAIDEIVKPFLDEHPNFKWWG
jgi:hypothetical protein